MVNVEEGGTVTAKIIDLGLAKAHDERSLCKPRFQLPELLPVHRSSPVRSSSQASR